MKSPLKQYIDDASDIIKLRKQRIHDGCTEDDQYLKDWVNRLQPIYDQLTDEEKDYVSETILRLETYL